MYDLKYYSAKLLATTNSSNITNTIEISLD